MDLPELSNEHRRHIRCIGESYLRLTGRPLVAQGGDLVEALWLAPLVIVAHGTQADPIFFFGNEAALKLFEMDFGAFTRLPSRFSVEPTLREERAQLFERVMRDGIIEDYAGVRLSATGKRFKISNTAVWNLTDETGAPAGQAAAFAEWVYVG